MKSEKAKRLLQQGRHDVVCKGSVYTQTFHPEGGYIRHEQAVMAVEAAELEAEQRMRDKAVEAHRSGCFFRNSRNNDCANTGTECGEHGCYYINDFIQKLSEQ